MSSTPLELSLKDKLHAYMQLTRFDKPVGIELLLWPTLWGVMLAAMGQAQKQGMVAGLPSLKVFIIFALRPSFNKDSLFLLSNNKAACSPSAFSAANRCFILPSMRSTSSVIGS